MNDNVDVKYNPDPDYKFFLYDPEGNGFEYFKYKHLRDERADIAIQEYLQDGWNEEVENIVVGEVTGQSKMVDVCVKPDELDDEGMDEGGEYWNSEFDYRCDYKIKPIGFSCDSVKLLKDEA